MAEQSGHDALVGAWVERLPEALTPEQLVSALEVAFSALWLRANRTLGEVTVLAIVDRVLYDASAHFALLGALKVEDGIEVRFGESRRRVTRRDPPQIREATRMVLIRFLTVIGDLTAEVLTPAMHQALGNVKVDGSTAKVDRPSQRPEPPDQGGVR